MGIPYKQPVGRSPFGVGGVGGVTVGSLTSESADARTQSVVVTDENGLAVTEPTLVLVFLAGTSGGVGVVSSAASGGLAAGTNGKLIGTLVTGKVALFQTDATGNLDVTITDNGTRNLYLAFAKNNGAVKVTSAIAFA
jgi:hypothetical protein